MIKRQDRNEMRKHRHRRVRRRVFGTAERPRLSVYRSLNQIYAQLIDDTTARTLLTVSSIDPELRKQLSNGGNVEAARRVGETLGARAKALGVTSVVFDRGGYLYHGRVAALADGARASGLEF